MATISSKPSSISRIQSTLRRPASMSKIAPRSRGALPQQFVDTAAQAIERKSMEPTHVTVPPLRGVMSLATEFGFHSSKVCIRILFDHTAVTTSVIYLVGFSILQESPNNSTTQAEDFATILHKLVE